MNDVKRNAKHQPRLGIGYLHTVVDDHSSVACVEMHADERSETAIGVLRRATTWIAGHGVTIERVLSDDGACYRSTPGEMLLRARHPPQTNPPLPTPGQREDRAFPPHPRRRLGIRDALHVRDRAAQRTTELDPLLHSAQATLRNRRNANRQTQQPAWTSHLEVAWIDNWTQRERPLRILLGC